MVRMDINKYIESKKNISVCNLLDDDSVLDFLDLNDYVKINSLNDCKKSFFSDEELLIVLLKSLHLDSDIIFRNTCSYNNVILLVDNQTISQENLVKYKNFLLAYGYKYFGVVNDERFQAFIYDIAEYKDKPEWLNNKNWANPELWEK